MPVPLSILIAPGRLRILRDRLLVDALIDFLADLPGIDRGEAPRSPATDPW